MFIDMENSCEFSKKKKKICGKIMRIPMTIISLNIPVE